METQFFSSLQYFFRKMGFRQLRIYVCMPMICWGLAGHAQSDSSENIFLQNRQHELGVNASALVSAVFGDPNNQLNEQGFPFLYKHILPSMNALRLGLEGNFQNASQRFDSGQGLVNRPQSGFMGIKLGIEKRKYMGKRWAGFWGVDALGKVANSNLETESTAGNTSIKTNTRLAGLGPVFGLQIALTKHIVLGAESSFYLTYQEDRTTSTFENLPNQENTSSNFQTIFQWNPPNSFYLSVRL